MTPRALRIPLPLSSRELRELLTADDLSHDAVLAAIGNHYCGEAGSFDPFDEAARALFGATGQPCEAQAKRLLDLLFRQLALTPDDVSADALILPAVLVTRRADPLVVAMIGHEIARRAGLDTRVCVAGAYAWTALLDADNCTLVGTSPLAGGGADESGFHVACSHETATLLLERLAGRARGRAQRCAASLAIAMRAGQHDVAHCSGHGGR